MKILFIGATGMLGKPVAKEMIRAGYDVTLMARNTDKMLKEFSEGRVTGGDVFDKQSLLHACTGIDTIYINLAVAQKSRETDPQPEREGMRNIVEAAKEKGVKRLIYLSSVVKNYQHMNGFSWWAFDIKQKAVDLIKSSGLNYTIFYASAFMETYPGLMIQGSKIMMIGKSIAPMWFIAAKDYAKQVVKSLETAGNQNKEYVIQGLQPFTFEEASRMFIDNYSKKKLKIMRAPMGMAKFFSHFSAKMNYGVHICEALNKYPEKFEGEKAWAELGKPAITLKDFITAL